MNNGAMAVVKIKSDEQLSDDISGDWKGHSVTVVSFEHLPECISYHFIDETHEVAEWTDEHETIVKLHNIVFLFAYSSPVHTLHDLYFPQSDLFVLRSRFVNFYCNVISKCEILCQPDLILKAAHELFDRHIPFYEHLSNVNWVHSPDSEPVYWLLIVRLTLLLSRNWLFGGDGDVNFVRFIFDFLLVISFERSVLNEIAFFYHNLIKSLN